jgi:hypothetical protein
MVSIQNEAGISCNFDNLDAAVEAARDYILALMENCDLSGRVVIIANGVFVIALNWENVW